MPYKSGFIQAALGALCTAAFIISQQFGSPVPKQKRLVGIIQKTGDQTFLLTESNARQHRFELSTPATIYLNEQQIPFSSVQNGRTVTVHYTKKKGHLFASTVDVFPSYNDFEPKSDVS